jgi:ketosteroid isomerase-like protein
VETFKQITMDWERATQARDVDRVAQIEADDWRSVNHDGTVSTKEDDLNGLRTGKDKHVVADFGPIDVKMLGDDVAVVYGTMTDKSATNNDGTRPAYAYMDVWVKRGGQWVVVRSQAFKMH